MTQGKDNYLTFFEPKITASKGTKQQHLYEEPVCQFAVLWHKVCSITRAEDLSRKAWLRVKYKWT